MGDSDKVKICVQIGITFILGIFAVILIYIEPDASSKLKWAYGIIGILLGYWLK